MNHKILLFLLFTICITLNSRAQNNTPNTGNQLSGTPTHVATQPNDFSLATPWLIGPTKYHFVRVFRPFMPMTTVPRHENMGSNLMSIQTTYMDAWSRPIQIVNQPNQYVKAIYTPIDNRPSTTQLSFLPYTTSATTRKGKFRVAPYFEQKGYYNNKYPDEGTTAYSKTVLENTNGVAKVKSYAPGKEFTGEHRGTTISAHAEYSYELPNAISSMGTYILKYDGTANTICTTGIYASNQISVKWTEGQEGQELFERYDKSGKLICKHTPDENGGYYTTYYVYNDLGQLTHILPPKQSTDLINNGCLNNVVPTSAPAQIFAYEYNEYGQVVNSQTPGKEGLDKVVYDQYNRPFLTQSPDLAANNKAHFTLYDKNGRTLITGIFNETQGMSQSYYDGIINGTTSLPNYLDGQGQSIADDLKLEYWLQNDLTVNDYPEDAGGEPFMAECEIHKLNFYDNYDAAPANAVSFDNGYSSEYQTGVVTTVPTPINLVHGKLVATKTRILDNGITHNWGNREWITSVHFYDEKGNVIQTHTLNPWQTTEWDIQTTQYNFVGEPILSILHHKGNVSGTANEITVYTRNGYQVGSGTPINSAIRIDNNTWRGINRVELDDLNQVVLNVLGESEYQSLTYNIRGQLTGINAGLLYTGALDNSTKVTYSSQLNYETGFDESRYDGKLTGYQWRTAGSTQPMAYGYNYDDAGRMTHAEYRHYDGTSAWVKNNRDYTVSNLSYDANGNILSMTQRGDDNQVTPGPAPTDIDVMTYTYDATGTRLTAVADMGNTSSSKIHDFVDGSNTGNDYVYSKNGNIITDNNRGIDVEYNFQDLPQEIDKGADGKVENIYTADGTLLQKTVTDNLNSTVETYHYWGPFVYKDNDLQMVMHGTGRVRNSSSGWEYDYFVKDHVGNVRTIVVGDQSYTTIPYSATFEQVSSSMEEAIFDQIGEVRDLNPQGTPGDLQSGILNGAISTERIGAALLVHAMAGEKFNVKGYGYYESDDTTAFNMYPMEGNMLSSLTDALTATVNTSGEGATANTATINSLLTSTNYSAYETMKAAATNSAYPRAYLNYLVFDDNHNLQTQYSHVVQIQGAPHSWQLMEIQGDIEMPITGFILTYFSNESHVDVAVDNIHVVEYMSDLLEAQHYYPHGLVIEDAGQGLTDPLNKYLFQGNKLQEELGVFINDFNFLQYDAQVGRFMAVDPLAEFAGQEGLNPYHFCGNDPVNFIDPDGLNFWSWLRGIFGSDGHMGGQRMMHSYDGFGRERRNGGRSNASGGGMPDSYSFLEIESIHGTASAAGGDFVGGGGGGYLADNTNASDIARWNERYWGAIWDENSRIAGGIIAESAWRQGMVNGATACGNCGTYDGKQMKPSSEYDYSIAENGQKFKDDWSYIINGEDGWWASRWRSLYLRDKYADNNAQTVEDVNILMDVSSALPLIRYGKLLIPRGFKEVKNFGYPHGQKVFSYKGKFYSRDVDSHNGGVWKVFIQDGKKLKRIGTADKNLQIIKK